MLFLYREVLAIDLPWMQNVVRAKRPQKLPVVLSKAETMALLARLSGRNGLMAGLLYGSGLRLMECIRLRVKDVDFERGELTVRNGKGGKDRKTVLPLRLRPFLSRQVEEVRTLCMPRIWRRGSVGWRCRSRWRANIPTRRWSLAGSTCFLLHGAPSIRATARRSGIT